MMLHPDPTFGFQKCPIQPEVIATEVVAMERCPIFIVIREEKTGMADYQRHVLCPHYDTCLDEAIVKNLTFDCSQCLYKKRNISVYLGHDGFCTPFDLEKRLRKA